MKQHKKNNKNKTREEGRKEENRKEWHMEKRRNNMRRGWDEEFNKVVTNTTPAYENKSSDELCEIYNNKNPIINKMNVLKRR